MKQKGYDLRLVQAVRLDDETAARPLSNGQWYIFAYEDDEGEIHEMKRASHLVLSELACMNLTDAICARTEGCGMFKDLQKELKAIRTIVQGVR